MEPTSMVFFAMVAMMMAAMTLVALAHDRKRSNFAPFIPIYLRFFEPRP